MDLQHVLLRGVTLTEQLEKPQQEALYYYRIQLIRWKPHKHVQHWLHKDAHRDTVGG